ncbi:MAG: type I-U CRISPR-associated protein Csb2 [Verrucomicrobiia bacterium]
MLIISIRFINGRAHLHPWQNASTQGDIDWPPSPWRLLRALVAVAGRGLTSLPRDADKAESLSTWALGLMQDADNNPLPGKIPLARLAELVAKLAQGPPVILLPRSQIGHLRLFHPDDKGNRSGDRLGSPFLDCFASVDPKQPIFFQWESMSLAPTEMVDLEKLLHRLPYFGRSESWCEAKLLTQLPESVEAGKTYWKCVCIEEADATTRKSLGKEHVDYEVKRRLAWEETDFQPRAQRLLGFIEQREAAQKKLQKEEDEWRKKGKGKDGSPPNKTKEHTTAESAVERWQSIISETKDLTLLRCLLRESGEDRKSGLPRPIGTRWVHYAVPREVFRVPKATRSKPKPSEDICYNPQSISETERAQIVRFALNTSTFHRAVLPNVTATVAVAQRIRTVALGIFGRQNHGKLSPQLTGKRSGDPDAPWQLFDQSHAFVTKLNDHAAHAQWWLTDEDHDGFLDHLNVFCENGFSRADVTALQSLVKVPQRDGFPDLLLTPIYVGRLDALRVPGFFEPSRKAKTFVSATPYFCPIHLTHGRGRGGKSRSLVDQIRKEIGQAGRNTTILEIVFDYDPATLNASPNPRLTAVTLPKDFNRDSHGKLTGVTYHPLEVTTFVANPPTNPTTSLGSCYPNALVKNPDALCPLGQRSGIYVADGTRFLPAQKFASTRRDDQTKGPGRMLLITFTNPRPATLFALGKFSHFGLGLFVPWSNGQT